MPEPHELLDAAMNQRRLELRMSWRDVAQAAEISYETLRAVRRGSYRPTDLTARGIEVALRWVQGSVFAVLGGGRPTVLPKGGQADEGSTPEAGDRPTLSQELELARRLLASTVREMRLTREEADEVWQRVRLEIEVTHRSPEGGGSDQSRTNRAV
ncbi:hypothetical protein [Streptomyces sp. NPDC006997]|uniref:hypothetical protein n=1 Tax=Streptomyces sp. NPDC006997 TaxID=3155356 RepID=UPI0033CD916A